MKLERHVGGLSRARKEQYLRERGWLEADGAWRAPVAAGEAYPLTRAVHHQLTADLCRALEPSGWVVAGYSQRGYARLLDPKDRSECSLPAALRRHARRQQVAVAVLTRSLFLAALHPTQPPSPRETAP